MTETAKKVEEYDRSCKAISFLALLILSALSHFWYIVIAICLAFIFWHAFVLLRQALFPVITKARWTFGR
jgi:energy-coupling factor transporter transmembrane protein EcfT